MIDSMKTRGTGKRKKNPISSRSHKMLEHSVANLKKGLAASRITEPKRSRRLGGLKGWMKIKGDIIHSDMEDDWEVQ